MFVHKISQKPTVKLKIEAFMFKIYNIKNTRPRYNYLFLNLKIDIILTEFVTVINFACTKLAAKTNLLKNIFNVISSSTLKL